jgi:hypothetical protein
MLLAKKIKSMDYIKYVMLVVALAFLVVGGYIIAIAELRSAYILEAANAYGMNGYSSEVQMELDVMHGVAYRCAMGSSITWLIDGLIISAYHCDDKELEDF